MAALPGVRSVAAEGTSRVMKRHDGPARRHTRRAQHYRGRSGKVGVGKSTVAVSLALGLAREGARVGLLDADVYGPNVPMMMGAMERPRQGEDDKILPVETYGIKLISMGFFIDPDSPVIWRGPMLSKLLTQFMYDVRWGELDYLVMDMPPGTGDVQLTTAQSLPLTGAIIVSTPQDVALLDGGKALMMYKKLNVPVLGMVENMTHSSAPIAAPDRPIRARRGAGCAVRFGVPFLGEIPLHLRIREGGTWRPVIVDDPESPEAEAFMHVARNLPRK